MPLRLRRALVIAVAAGTLFAGLAAPPAGAETSPTGAVYRKIAFPAQQPVHYVDDFGACRDGCSRHHEGNDIMGARLLKEYAATDATVTIARSETPGSKSGNMLVLEDAAGWSYWYMHINNDTPGTDDAANPAAWRFAPGITVGKKVKAGQFVAYMGDSGNAEGTSPHLHFELHKPDDTPVSPYTSLRLAQGLAAGGLCAFPSNPKPTPSALAGAGYWTVNASGRVRKYGSAALYTASEGSMPFPNPIADMATTPTGEGYWLVDDTGVVYPFGDAKQRGGTGNMHINAPIIGIWPTATGKGYWLLAEDGGIFSFGDAKFYGSTGAKQLNAPIIAMAGSATGKGYWLLAGDGGIFTFGDAHFYGSTGAMKLDKPIVAMAATPTGAGYWLLTKAGGIFPFGDARYKGSLTRTGLCNRPNALAITPTLTGKGYWILQADGRIASYGDAKYYGDPRAVGGTALSVEVVPENN